MNENKDFGNIVLPTQINIDAELDEIRKVQKLLHNKAETISSKTYNILIDELTEVEERIKNKLEPVMLKYCEKGDYEGAKWFIGKSYKDVSSSGKILLFRSILVHQQQREEGGAFFVREEMRDDTDVEDSQKKSLNKNKTEGYDSFIINVKYEVGYSDIDIKNILTSALQKYYKGWDNKVILDTWDFDYKVKNTTIELMLIESKYYDETYEVIYNQNKDEYDEMDDKTDVFNFVKKCIERITHYTYRSVYSMDERQKADIKILAVSKLG